MRGQYCTQTLYSSSTYLSTRACRLGAIATCPSHTAHATYMYPSTWSTVFAQAYNYNSAFPSTLITVCLCCMPGLRRLLSIFSALLDLVLDRKPSYGHVDARQV